MKAGLLVLCVLPLGAHAQIFTVEYEGTVYSADAGAPYEIGDTVSGRLFLDTLLMGRDLDPLDRNQGFYGSHPDKLPSTDFVTGFAKGLPAYDSLSVRNDFRFETSNDPVDTYQIRDESAFGTARFMHLLLYADLPPTTFDDDRGDQTFDAVSKTLGDMVGTLAWGWGETRRQVDFFLSRFSVKPGRCVVS